VVARKPEKQDQLRAWGCEVVQGDMTDADSLRRAVEGCETVVHLVAILLGSPDAFERIMVQGTRDLVEALFLEELRNEALAPLGDSAVVAPADGRLALTTDSYVVRPLVFPGGDIGELAVNGTLNDLAVAGARPLWLTAGFVLEEGLPVELLRDVVRSMAAAAERAGVPVAAGDTKVVERGKADGLYVTTAGVGVLDHDLQLVPASGT